jgi:ATP-binding protein involved in chromosome partitioning
MTMEPRTSVINKRLKSIRRIIAIASGKGGVGKSLVASALALSLAKKGHKVGLLDLDLYGPSSHIVLGVTGAFPKEENGLVPPTVHGIKFMSIVYFTEEKPSPFRGIDITNIILELLAITQWSELDYLIIDMPPGIGDEALDVMRFIPQSEYLVVTTPSKVAMGAVNKLLVLLKELKKPVLGVLENMAMNDSSYIKKEVQALGLPYLGKIKFDEKLEDAIGDPDRLSRTAFMKELEKIMTSLVR